MSAKAVGREQWCPIKVHGRANRRAKSLIFRTLITHVTEIYELDKEGAFTLPINRAATQLVRTQLPEAATLLSDLVSTAWMRSGRPIPQEPGWRGTIEDPSTCRILVSTVLPVSVPPDGPQITMEVYSGRMCSATQEVAEA